MSTPVHLITVDNFVNKRDTRYQGSSCPLRSEAPDPDPATEWAPSADSAG